MQLYAALLVGDNSRYFQVLPKNGVFIRIGDRKSRSESDRRDRADVIQFWWSASKYDIKNTIAPQTTPRRRLLSPPAIPNSPNRQSRIPGYFPPVITPTPLRHRQSRERWKSRIPASSFERRTTRERRDRQNRSNAASRHENRTWGYVWDSSSVVSCGCQLDEKSRWDWPKVRSYFRCDRTLT